MAPGQEPSVGQSAGVQSDERTHAAMVAKARALVPRLRDRAARTEELRHLPPETELDLHEAGLFRMLQPRRIGGAELDYVALIDCADLLGQADASVAWNLANLASHHWMLGMFEQTAQDLVWGRDPDALIASSFIFPAGRGGFAPPGGRPGGFGGFGGLSGSALFRAYRYAPDYPGLAGKDLTPGQTIEELEAKPPEKKN